MTHGVLRRGTSRSPQTRRTGHVPSRDVVRKKQTRDVEKRHRVAVVAPRRAEQQPTPASCRDHNTATRSFHSIRCGHFKRFPHTKRNAAPLSEGSPHHSLSLPSPFACETLSPPHSRIGPTRNPQRESNVDDAGGHSGGRYQSVMTCGRFVSSIKAGHQTSRRGSSNGIWMCNDLDTSHLFALENTWLSTEDHAPTQCWVKHARFNTIYITFKAPARYTRFVYRAATAVSSYLRASPLCV